VKNDGKCLAHVLNAKLLSQQSNDTHDLLTIIVIHLARYICCEGSLQDEGNLVKNDGMCLLPTSRIF
jgi:hypothetical protein